MPHDVEYRQATACIEKNSVKYTYVLCIIRIPPALCRGFIQEKFMSMTDLVVGEGYEVSNPPILEMQPGEPHHQLGRFFTVVALEDGGVRVYDGAYDSGVSTVHLPAEIVSQLSIQKLTKTGETTFADLMTAVVSSAAAANEQRTLVAGHSSADDAVDASHRFFVQFLSGQIKGLAAKGVINPNLAVIMTVLATGVELA